MNDDNNDDYMVSAKALRKLLETTFEYENKRNEKFDHSYFEYLFSKDKTLKGLKFSKYLMFDEKGDIMRAVGSLRFVYNLIINEVNRRQKVETLKEAAKYLDNVDMKELEAEMPNMIGLSSKQMNWMFPLERKSEKPEKKPFPVNTKLETKKAKKDKKPKKSLYKSIESNLTHNLSILILAIWIIFAIIALVFVRQRIQTNTISNNVFSKNNMVNNKCSTPRTTLNSIPIKYKIK